MWKNKSILIPHLLSYQMSVGTNMEFPQELSSHIWMTTAWQSIQFRRIWDMTSNISTWSSEYPYRAKRDCTKYQPYWVWKQNCFMISSGLPNNIWPQIISLSPIMSLEKIINILFINLHQSHWQQSWTPFHDQNLTNNVAFLSIASERRQKAKPNPLQIRLSQTTTYPLYVTSSVLWIPICTSYAIWTNKFQRLQRHYYVEKFKVSPFSSLQFLCSALSATVESHSPSRYFSQSERESRNKKMETPKVIISN